MPCGLCETLPQHIRSDKKHERLRQIGLTERVSGAGRTRAAWITYYTCEICESKWQHVDDPANEYAGWSIEKHPASTESLDGQSHAHAAIHHS